MLDFRYLAHGTATDYMYDVVRVPMAFTFEVCEMQTLLIKFLTASLSHLGLKFFCIIWQIYGDNAASSKDCFKMFNPVDHITFNV